MFSANENLQLRQHKRRVVEFVEATIPDAVLELGVNVMAMQVNCKAPGCVPIETCIIVVFPAVSANQELLPGLPESAGGSYKTKVLKPMSAVERDDVLQALPPAFTGGQRSVERLCLQARDVMLGQITQLFGDTDVAGRTLMAEYLQSSLQQYMDRNCEPPEWGESFPAVVVVPPLLQQQENETTGPPSSNATTNEANAASSLFGGTGNVIIQRPADDDEGTTISSSAVRDASASIVLPPSLLPPSLTTTTTTTKLESSSVLLLSSTVNSVTKRRQQQAAVKNLLPASNSNNAASSLLNQLSQREHAPGVRRPGCPCCDPDNLSNVVDKLMMQM